jgi:hypothetical protein
MRATHCSLPSKQRERIRSEDQTPVSGTVRRFSVQALTVSEVKHES